MEFLVGKHNTCSPTMGSLGGEFGKQQLIGKTLASIKDAKLGSRTDRGAVAETLLSISGEDRQTINRKNKDFWHGHLGTRFVVLTNELPHLDDTSGALVSRFVILRLRQSFLGREDHKLTAKLLVELPGILNWSIAGWRRLQERGRFVMPSSALEDVQAFEDLASPLAAFVRDNCVVEAGATIEKAVLFRRWKAHCGDDRDAGAENVFTVKLGACCPGLQSIKKVLVVGETKRRVPCYVGIRLKKGDEQ